MVRAGLRNVSSPTEHCRHGDRQGGGKEDEELAKREAAAVTGKGKLSKLAVFCTRMLQDRHLSSQSNGRRLPAFCHFALNKHTQFKAMPSKEWSGETNKYELPLHLAFSDAGLDIPPQEGWI
ncbi:hypothetical protein llap_636 [Limosa lapponica baueri]|uniref:Uncharacterized protein n=1 Tax=Limosa lapponica baueri TaxID=1758121 RepID=A0A2I0USF2_LIMLA|nr:hypothetical protein llap_636 [Limosa lapponica baueri]